MAKYIDLPNLKENLTNFLNKKINPIYAKKTEIPSNVSELNNDKSYQTAEEVGQAVTDGVARIVAGAPEDFDTLKEMSDWISSHETSAAAMNSAISDNSVAIANHTSNSDIHVTKEEKTKWNKLDSDLKDGTIIVAEATKATQDAQGNVIDSTYAKKTEVPQGTVVDDALSSTSINPVQNKVVKAEFDQVNSDLSNLKDGTTPVAKAVADEDGNNIKNTYATKAKAFIDYSHKSVDLDTLTTAPSLISIGYDVTNKPSKFYGGYMFVVNAGYSASIALYQILFDVLYNKTYQRKYYHGSWTAWSYVTTPQDIETITLTTTSGTATLYKLGKMRHLVLNNATFSSTNVIASTDASVGTLYIRAEILISGSGGDELEGAAASFEDICISGSSMWNATRTATGTSPIAVQGATGSATWIVQ